MPAFGADRWFRAAGYDARWLTGPRSGAIASALLRAHYLRGGGMQGTRVGMIAPDGALVGIACFARAAHPAFAAGMFPPSCIDASLCGGWRRQLEVQEAEVWTLTRFYVAERQAGHKLGTGAESWFQRCAFALIAERNRETWRATRRAELGLTPWTAAALRPFVKVLVTFSDPSVGHTGGIYRAAGWIAAGETREERGWIGRRSGSVIAKRTLTKVGNPDTPGHRAAVLRLLWEGARPVVSVNGDVGAALAGVPPDVAGVPSSAALRRAWGASGGAALPHIADAGSGLSEEIRPPKRRFVALLGTPSAQRALARRCRHLRVDLAAADAAWFAPARRWPRGVGRNWPRRPADDALLRWARALEA